ncbi:MAG: hypothetical protein AAGH40_13410, partial [Verrucomicrobiota bacterium]
MSAIFHLLKKDIRQHKLLVGLFLAVCLFLLIGHNLRIFFPITNGIYYDLLRYAETVALCLFLGLCVNLGYRNNPFNKDHFFATRPIRLPAQIAAKLLLVFLLIFIVTTGAWLTTLNQGLPSAGVIRHYTPFFFCGWTVVMLSSLWRTPGSLGFGLLGLFFIFVTALIAVGVTYEYLGLIQKSINGLIFMPLTFLFSSLLFALSLRIGRPTHPLCIGLCFLLCAASIAGSCNTPARLTYAPEGTREKVFIDGDQSHFWISPSSKSQRTVSLNAALARRGIAQGYGMKTIAKRIGLTHEEDELLKTENQWSHDSSYLHLNSEDIMLFLHQLLRPEQIKFLPKRESSSWGKHESIEEIKIPDGILEGNLDFSVQLSHQVHRYERLATLPLKAGASANIENKKLTILKIKENSRHPNRSIIWVKWQRTAIEHSHLRHGNILYFATSETQPGIEELYPVKSSRAGSLDFNQFEVVGLGLRNNWRYRETEANPRDYRLEIFGWRYVGIIESPSETLTTSVDSLFFDKTSYSATPTYPVHHTMIEKRT